VFCTDLKAVHSQADTRSAFANNGESRLPHPQETARFHNQRVLIGSLARVLGALIRGAASASVAKLVEFYVPSSLRQCDGYLLDQRGKLIEFRPVVKRSA